VSVAGWSVPTCFQSAATRGRAKVLAVKAYSTCGAFLKKLAASNCALNCGQRWPLGLAVVQPAMLMPAVLPPVQLARPPPAVVSHQWRAWISCTSA
jgi:hypothetical protein